MALLIFFAFCAIWFLPIFLKQRKEENPVTWKSVLLAILVGAVPCAIVLILLQSLLGWVLVWLKIEENSIVYNAIYAFLLYGTIEEFTKFFGGWFFVRKHKDARKVHYVVLFGAAALGYEIIETMWGLAVSSGIDAIIGAFIRGPFIAHVMWEFFLGAQFFEYKKAKCMGNTKKATRRLILAFAYPILSHGLNDFINSFMNKSAVTDEEMVYNFMINLILIALNVVNLVIGIVAARKSLKEHDTVSY